MFLKPFALLAHLYTKGWIHHLPITGFYYWPSAWVVVENFLSLLYVGYGCWVWCCLCALFDGELLLSRIYLMIICWRIAVIIFLDCLTLSSTVDPWSMKGLIRPNCAGYCAWSDFHIQTSRLSASSKLLSSWLHPKLRCHQANICMRRCP